MANSYAGTRIYMSPQVSAREEYSNKTDVWSTGIVFIEMMTLKKLKIAKLLTFTKLDPTTVNLSNENDRRLVDLRQCICDWMIVGKEEERANVASLVKNSVFHEQYSLKTLNQAKQWLNNEQPNFNYGDGNVQEELNENDGDNHSKVPSDNSTLPAQTIDMESQVNFN